VTEVTGAPSSFPPAAEASTLEQIEFYEALDVVSQHALSACGAERVRARRPSTDPEHVANEIEHVAALVRLFRDGDRFHPAGPPDIRNAMELLRLDGSALDGQELFRLGQAFEAMRETERELRRVAVDEPVLGTFAVDVPPEEVPRRIAKAIDPDGAVKDDASPELRKARQKVRDTRARLVRTLEVRLRETRGGESSTEANVTVRNGRYVIPLRRDAKSNVQGIVHGESASGATVFVEPTDAVDLGNDLNAAVAAEQREVLRVLRELTELSRGSLSEAEAGWEMCLHTDDLFARGRYVIEVDGAIPVIADAAGQLVVRGARHPLLLVEMADVVPFDLETREESRVIVVSGPNTGGKTVLLKAVGVVCALVQSGVVPPVKRGTQVPVFSGIFADIGDHQSIAASLSTFSGHLEALNRILIAADERALILLDEFGTGTDPVEGAALAGAVLRTICGRGSVAIATTHLGQIKQLAVETPGAINASLQFDPHKLEPTYRFLIGVPGRSYGLDIARSLGFPGEVLRAAEDLLPQGERSLDALLADLEGREHSLAGREQDVGALESRLAAERDGLEELQRALADRADELEAERRRIETSGRAEARRFLLDARKRVDEALGVARAAMSEATAREARRLVEAGVQDEGDALKRLQEEARRKGWTVRGKGVDRSEATEVAGPNTTPGLTASRRVAKRIRRRPAVEAEVSAPTLGEVNLRGLMGDEAEDALLRAIDEAVVEDLSELRIIHGKGTGALRHRVGEVLTRDKRVRTSRQGVPSEGGWGVTVAELRR